MQDGWHRRTGRGGRVGCSTPVLKIFEQNAYVLGKSTWDKLFYRVRLLQHDRTVHLEVPMALLPICRSLAIVNSMDNIINILKLSVSVEVRIVNPFVFLVRLSLNFNAYTFGHCVFFFEQVHRSPKSECVRTPVPTGSYIRYRRLEIYFFQ